MSRFRLVLGRPVSAPPPEPQIGYLVPGSLAVGAWPDWTNDDLEAMGITRQGDPGEYGYVETPTCGWLTAQDDDASGDDDFWIGVAAYASTPLSNIRAGQWHGIREVHLCAAGGERVVTTEMTTREGIEGWWFKTKGSLVGIPGAKELRAVCVPLVGIPRIMQGFPNAAIAQPDRDFSRVNCFAHVWSLILNYQPTKTIVHIGPAGDDESGDGSSAAPFATFDRCIEAIQDVRGGDLGGGEIHLLAGEYIGGCETAPSTPMSASSPLVIKRATGVGVEDAIFTGWTDAGFNVERLRFDGVRGQGSGDNVEGRGFYRNRPSAEVASTSNLYGSSHFRALEYDGGPAYDDNFDGPGKTWWNGPGFSSTAQGFNTYENCTVTRTAGSGAFYATLMKNCAFDYLGGNSDVSNNCKVFANVTVKNIIPAIDNPDVTGEQIRHADVFQLVHPALTPPWLDDRVNYITIGVVAEHIEGVQDFTIQGNLIDLTTPIRDFAAVDCTYKNGPSPSPAFQIGARAQNVLVKGLRAGGVSLRRDTTPSGNAISGMGSYSRSQHVTFIFDGSDPIPYIPPIWGVRVITPSITEDYGDPQPVASYIQSIVPDNEIYGLIDVSMVGRRAFRDNLDGTLSVVTLQTCVDYGATYSSANKTVTANTAYYEQPTRSQAPRFDPAGMGDLPTAVFDPGDQSISGPNRGCAMSNANVGFPLPLRATSALGAGVGEIWTAFVLDDAPVASTGTANDRVYFAAGGTSQVTSIELRRRMAVANENAIYCGIGVANGGATRVVSVVTPAGYSWEGPLDTRIQILSDRLRLTVWNADNPDGVTVEAAFSAGEVNNITGGRFHLGGDTANSVGTANRFPTMAFAEQVFLAPQTTNAAAIIAARKARFLGL